MSRLLFYSIRWSPLFIPNVYLGVTLHADQLVGSAIADLLFVITRSNDILRCLADQLGLARFARTIPISHNGGSLTRANLLGFWSGCVLLGSYEYNPNASENLLRRVLCVPRISFATHRDIHRLVWQRIRVPPGRLRRDTIW